MAIPPHQGKKGLLEERLVGQLYQYSPRRTRLGNGLRRGHHIPWHASKVWQQGLSQDMDKALGVSPSGPPLLFASRTFRGARSLHSLDRISVRPLPRGYKPRIGVELIDDSLLADPERHHGDNTPSKDLQGRVFSIQYGLRTVSWAAGSSQKAKAWIQAIRRAWVNAILNPQRSLRVCSTILQKGIHDHDMTSHNDSRDSASQDSSDCTNSTYISHDDAVYNVEIHTRMAEGWGKAARPWIALHGQTPGATSGRHLLVPLDGCEQEPFSAGATATCQIRTSFVSPHDIHFVELGLHGNCQLWAPEKVCIRAEGESSWRVFPSDSLLSTPT